jgi:hypothetical protein
MQQKTFRAHFGRCAAEKLTCNHQPKRLNAKRTVSRLLAFHLFVCPCTKKCSGERVHSFDNDFHFEIFKNLKL